MEFLKTILVVVITGWIGNKITQIFQEKSFRNQQKVKNAETEMERITVISTRLIQAASKRRFALQNLVDELIGNKDIERDDITSLRKNYRETVQVWNGELQLLMLELSSLSLDNLAMHLEDSVHRQFVLAHQDIKSYLVNQEKNKLDDIVSRLNQVYASTQNINNTLIKEAHNKKEEILHGDTEKLSIWNLDKAPNWILFVAIFHSTPNNLRIPRSF